MNGGDKILERIRSDSDSAVQEILSEAQKNCELIIAQANAQADKSVDEICSKAKAKYAQINASSKSRAELQTRNALLKRRRTEIDKTVGELQSYLVNLGDKEYFDALYSLAAQLKGKSGMVFLNAKDLNRLPSDFEAQLKSRGLDASVSGESADITGGFVLKSGDIEENMDFSALISARRDEIEDLINKELFAQ